MGDFRQHDSTDCGAMCLAYVFHKHQLRVPVSLIRQKTGTTRSGTTALGLVDVARSYGFEAKGVRCNFEDLRSISVPGIAHVLVNGDHQHYVVVCSIGRKKIRVMDPAVGTARTWSVDDFRTKWTNVFVMLTPSVSFEPENSDTTWMRLVKLLRPHKAILLQAFVGVVISTVLSLAGAIYIQKIIDNVILDGNRNLLRLLSLGMLGVLFIRIVLGYFQGVLVLRSAQRIDAGLILGYYRHLLYLPQSFFDTMRVGEITSRVRDAVAIRNFLNGAVLGLVLNPLILVCSFAAMFAYSWVLALYSLALIPVNLGIYYASDWLQKRYQREIMERSAEFDSQMIESLHAISVVKSCGMQEEMGFRTEARLVRVMKRAWSAATAGFVVSGAGSLLNQGYSIGLLWIGTVLVLESKLTAGELLSCNALAGYITGPLIGLLGMNATIRTATTAAERLFEIIDIEREKTEGAADLNLRGPFQVRLDKVSFCYCGRLPTFTNVSLSFESGTVTAIVGKSGSGKSTLLSLLQRSYSPQSGKVLIAGVDCEYIQLAALRQSIAFVPQRIELLAGTVLENLAPNEEQPDMIKLVAICKRVGILDFVEELPQGFHTRITENGANLSGGQKQRMAIARALYADARIMLLDEPSSALDLESESALAMCLEDMRADGKMVVMAAHNERLLAVCDRVLRIDNGCFLETGPAVCGTSQGGSLAQVDETALAIKEVISPSVEALRNSLRTRALGGILFGQTDTNIMGSGDDGKGWFLQGSRCDIRSVTGRRPGLYGFEIERLSDGWKCGHILPKIREAFEEGGAVLVGWRPENIVTRQNCWAGSAVPHILTNGRNQKDFHARLDMIADHLGNIRGKNGALIPILMRIWPQPNTERFWWGRSRCTEKEYIQLYRATVSYLREVRKVRNFLFVYSVGHHAASFDACMARYPGDGYVDAIGVEHLSDFSASGHAVFLSFVADAVSFARERNKPVGITSLGFQLAGAESGLAANSDPSWLYTGFVKPLTEHPTASQIAFICFRRNDYRRPTAYELPPLNSPHARSLVDVVNSEQFVFGDRLEGLYGPDHAALIAALP